MNLTAEQVQRVCVYARSAKVAEMLPHMNASLSEAQIDSPLRAAMWLAQIAHETGQLRWFAEIWGDTPAQHKYEGRVDLGNLQPGDGYRYRGRGAIQVTGRANYRAAGAALNLPLEEQPDLASKPENAFRVAAWFWVTATDHRHAAEFHGKHLNDYADAGDVEGATHVINGGLNGLMDRHLLYDRACDAMGVLAARFA